MTLSGVSSSTPSPTFGAWARPTASSASLLDGEDWQANAVAGSEPPLFCRNPRGRAVPGRSRLPPLGRGRAGGAGRPAGGGGARHVRRGGGRRGGGRFSHPTPPPPRRSPPPPPPPAGGLSRPRAVRPRPKHLR